jgi:hypothetical protein
MAAVSTNLITPRVIRVEASSACQLRCPACPTGQGLTGKTICGTGFLQIEDFKRLLSNNPTLREIELSNWGEVFLNPHFSEILEFAYRARVKITILNGVNLNHASDKALEALVKYQLSEMVVALDGACDKTYSVYRKRGNFDRVIANVKKINALKKKYQSSKPRLIWQFVLFGHNEHEIGAARRHARQLGMAFAPKLNAVPEYSPLKDPERALQEAGLSIPGVGRDWHSSICTQLWKSPQINWDGKILGCCHNNWRQFGGNAFTGKLTDSLNSEGIQYARAMLRGKVPPRTDIPCTDCAAFKARTDHNTWVSETRMRAEMIAERLPLVRRLFNSYKRSCLLNRLKRSAALPGIRASRPAARTPAVGP